MYGIKDEINIELRIVRKLRSCAIYPTLHAEPFLQIYCLVIDSIPSNNFSLNFLASILHSSRVKESIISFEGEHDSFNNR